MADFRHETLANGLGLALWSTNKFKTNTFRFILPTPLGAHAAENALVPMVLRRGSRQYPDTRLLMTHLDDLYGADLRADAYKLGEEQALVFHVSMANDRYLPGDEGILEDGIALLQGVIEEPVSVDGALRVDYVAQERENLRRQIESIINDKAQFAAIRCVEVMAEGTPYAIGRYGRVQDLEAVTPRGLMDRYRQLMRGPATLYVVGDLEWDTLERTVAERFRTLHATKWPPVPAPLAERDGVRRVEERQDVNQGKLVMGFTTGIVGADPSYPAMVVANGVFGGFAHSKLFLKVREEASLAYYAYARLDGYKGVCLVSAGLEFHNRDRALDIIEQQLMAMQDGDITEEELDRTRRGLVNGMRAAEDSPSQSIMRDLELRRMGRDPSLERRIDAIESVTREQAVEAARRIRLDTVYFLNREGEGAHRAAV